jgi:hypothetical protein
MNLQKNPGEGKAFKLKTSKGRKIWGRGSKTLVQAPWLGGEAGGRGERASCQDRKGRQFQAVRVIKAKAE